MVDSIIQAALFSLAGGVLGVVAGYVIGTTFSKRRIDMLTMESRKRLDDISRQKDQLAIKFSKSRSTIQTLKDALIKHRTELESVIEKSKKLAKGVRTLRAERERTKSKVSRLQTALDSVKQQTVAIQCEFERAAKFYKGELIKSFEKRKAIEGKYEQKRAEQESFAKLVEASILEHGSPDKMITEAQLRFGQLEVLERNVNKLEAENAQLTQEAVRLARANEAQARDLAELDELKINNKQLVQCVEALENSRRQYECEAEQYRDQADQSEQESDTLRLKLNDLEKNFADIERQQQQALSHAREATVDPESPPRGPSRKKTDVAPDVVSLARYSNRR